MRISLKDSRTYDIPFRQLAVVDVTWLDVGLLAPGEPQPIYDTVVTVPLKEIDRIERLPATEAAVIQ